MGKCQTPVRSASAQGDGDLRQVLGVVGAYDHAVFAEQTIIGQALAHVGDCETMLGQKRF